VGRSPPSPRVSSAPDQPLNLSLTSLRAVVPVSDEVGSQVDLDLGESPAGPKLTLTFSSSSSTSLAVPCAVPATGHALRVHRVLQVEVQRFSGHKSPLKGLSVLPSPSQHGSVWGDSWATPHFEASPCSS